MVEHTPGPWIAQLHFAQKNGGKSYAMVTAKGHLVPVGAAILGVEGMSEDEGRANARLFAAGPEMLAALKSLQGRVQPQYRSVIDAAIAKAALPPQQRGT